MSSTQALSDQNNLKVLHIANWFPSPWNKLEGNFVARQINVFCDEISGSAVVVQVRQNPGKPPRFCRARLAGGVPGYYLMVPFDQGGRFAAVLTAILLIVVLVGHRFWRYSALHFHIANPLLSYVGLWKNLVRKPILISEHWSAYHYDFYLPRGSKNLKLLRSPFHHEYPLLAVSQALIQDIYSFSQSKSFPAYVIPNVVPIHGPTSHDNPVVRLFTVNRWVDIKDPMPMLEGLALAIEAGAQFQLIIGGGGELLNQMMKLVHDSSLASSTQFLAWMDQDQIESELACADGYLFSSRYETFSIACAEALGAGVPLIGPMIPAIAEYADHPEWQMVPGRSASDWKMAIFRFIERFENKEFDPNIISRRCAERFAPDVIKKQYREIVEQCLFK